jgi:DNA-binding phage protein
MGRNMNERKACDNWFANHDKKVANFGEALGKTIRYAARDRTITQFANDIHYTRTTLTTLLNQKADDPKQRAWTLSTLLAIADALGVELSVLIAEAEAVSKGALPGMGLRIASTEPRSQERMQKLIYEAVGYSGDADEKNYDGMLEVLYRVVDVVYAVPAMWERYHGGLLSDDEALGVFKSAVEAAENEEPQPPFWAAVQREWNRVAECDAKN